MKINGWKGYLVLSIFLVSFIVLLWVFDPQNLWFQLIGTLLFAATCSLSVVHMFRLKKKLNDVPFLIRKGDFSITERRPIRIKGNDLSFRFNFTEQHKYNSPDNPDKNLKNQVNKLLGLSTLDIHRNSVRVGWRHIQDNRFMLYAYIYCDFELEIVELQEVKTWEKFHVAIESFKDVTSIWILGDDTTYIDNIGVECKWVVFPYFGGTVPAPHDMYFDIKMKY